MSVAMQRYLPRVLLLVVMIMAGLSGLGSKTQAQTNEYCPVTTSEKADPNIFLDYQGKRVHFCCNKCKRDFLADPDAYLANLKGLRPEPTSDKLAHYAQDAEREAEEAAQHDDGHDHVHTMPGSDSMGLSDGTVLPEDQSDLEEVATHSHDAESESDHDHATDHGEGTSLIGFLGKFHPVVVHFPIALVFMALIFVGTRFVLGMELFDQMAAVTIYWAAFFAIVAALLGLARSSGANFPTTLEEYFEWHRLLGLVSTGLTAFTAIAAYYWRNKARRGGRSLFVALLILNVIAIGVTGHLGATLVYGPNYYGL